MNGGTLGFPRARSGTIQAKAPDEITSSALQAWYDFSSPLNTTTPSKFSTLYDLSGNGRHITQSTDSSRATVGTMPDGVNAAGVFAGGQIYVSSFTPTHIFGHLYVVHALEALNVNNYSFICSARNAAGGSLGLGIYILGTGSQNTPNSDFAWHKNIPPGSNTIPNEVGSLAAGQASLAVTQQYAPKTGAIAFRIGRANANDFYRGRIAEVVLLGNSGSPGPMSHDEHLALCQYFVERYNLL